MYPPTDGCAARLSEPPPPYNGSERIYRRSVRTRPPCRSFMRNPQAADSNLVSAYGHCLGSATPKDPRADYLTATIKTGRADGRPSTGRQKQIRFVPAPFMLRFALLPALSC